MLGIFIIVVLLFVLLAYAIAIPAWKSKTNNTTWYKWDYGVPVYGLALWLVLTVLIQPFLHLELLVVEAFNIFLTSAMAPWLKVWFQRDKERRISPYFSAFIALIPVATAIIFIIDFIIISPITSVIAVFLPLSIINYAIDFPAWFLGKHVIWRRFEYGNPIYGLLIWILLLFVGNGKTLANLIELPVILLVSIVSIYLRLIFPGKTNRLSKISSLASAFIPMIISGCMAMFIPALPE